MKGIIFNYLEDYVTENHGVDKWEELLDLSPKNGDKIFIGPISYSDKEFIEIVDTYCQEMRVDKTKLLRDFGYFLFFKLSDDFPVFLLPYDEPISFLKSIETVIHVEVRKSMEGATPPSFVFRDIGDQSLNVVYRSKRQMCELMEGIIEAVAAHFKRRVEIKKVSCVHLGDEECSVDLFFSKI